MENNYIAGFRLDGRSSFGDEAEDANEMHELHMALMIAKKTDDLVTMLQVQQGSGRPAGDHQEEHFSQEVSSRTLQDQGSPGTTGHPEGILWEEARYGTLGDSVDLL